MTRKGSQVQVLYGPLKKSLIRGSDLRPLFFKNPPLATVVSNCVSNEKMRLLKPDCFLISIRNHWGADDVPCGVALMDIDAPDKYVSIIAWKNIKDRPPISLTRIVAVIHDCAKLSCC